MKSFGCFHCPISMKQVALLIGDVIGTASEPPVVPTPAAEYKKENGMSGMAHHPPLFLNP